MASEFELIGRYFSRPAPADMLGVGDDCALFSVPPGMQLATSTDLLLEGRHFFSSVDPQSLGHKSLAVNLSDLAAMGATPLACVLGLGLPRADETWVAAFAKGFHDLCQQHNCPLIGGDTTRSEQGIVISVTVFGAVESTHALRRNAGQAGDEVWVSGTLGRADVAYRLLAGLLPPNDVVLAATQPALEWPSPQIALGRALIGVAHAALDLSDGLLQDLGHILKASGLGARLNYDAMPVDPSLHALPSDVVQHAVLAGGDVYELCFTAAADRHDDVLAAAKKAGVSVHCIGVLCREQGVVVRDAAGRTITPASLGFDHFPSA